jgi:hypothetical protein
LQLGKKEKIEKRKAIITITLFQISNIKTL